MPDYDDSAEPNLDADTEYVLLRKLAYQMSVWSAQTQNAPAFGDNDHDLWYKIADSGYSMAP